MNNEILKPIKVTSIILLIEFIFLFSFFKLQFSNYDKNLFEVKLNGIEMNCFYNEKYNNGLLIKAGTGGYNSVENRVNEIELDDNINLIVNEYEVYYKSGNRKQDTTGWLKSDNYNYKKVNNSNVKLKITRMNKTLYDGPYINDLSNIINEKGRYYIHIYSKRKDGIFININTHISFNVVVGGGNRV